MTNPTSAVPPAQPRQIGRAPPPPSPPSRRAPIIIGAVIIVVVAGGGWWLGRSSASAPFQQSTAIPTQTETESSAANTEPTAATVKLNPSAAAGDMRKVLAAAHYMLFSEETPWKESKEAISDFDASRQKASKPFSANWLDDRYIGVWVVSKMSTDAGATYKTINGSKLCLAMKDKVRISDGSLLYIQSVEHLNTPDHQIFVTFPDKTRKWFVTDTDKPGVFLLQEMTLSGKAPVQFHEGSRVHFTVE